MPSGPATSPRRRSTTWGSSTRSGWVPAVTNKDDLDHEELFNVHREATAKAIRKAMHHEPTIDWLLENQDQVQHYFHELGIKGEL